MAAESGAPAFRRVLRFDARPRGRQVLVRRSVSQESLARLDARGVLRPVAFRAIKKVPARLDALVRWAAFAGAGSAKAMADVRRNRRNWDCGEKSGGARSSAPTVARLRVGGKVWFRPKRRRVAGIRSEGERSPRSKLSIGIRQLPQSGGEQGRSTSKAPFQS